ncbi:MAG TPA: hypothetical protein VF530_17125 [Planctomycetota bacterium]
MHARALLLGWIFLGACAPADRGAGPVSLPVPPAGLLRDPEEWAALPRTGRDAECEPGTSCARSLAGLFAWASRWDDPGLVPDITEQLANDSDHDVVALACALAWRASDDEAWRERARSLLEAAVHMPYPRGGSALRPGRNLLAYVLAASTLELAAFDPLLEHDFRAWCEGLAEVDLWQGDGVDVPGTFRAYQEQRANNVGLVVGAARIAVDLYLGGPVHLAHVAEAERVVRRFLGEPSDFQYPPGAFGGGRDDRSWQADPSPGRQVGVNPVGARIPPGLGLLVDGALPEEMRRLAEPDCLACGFVPSILCYNAADALDGGDPPGIAATGYPWEALQGLVLQVYLLWRSGYDAFAWGDRAVERAHRFLYLDYGLRAQDTWNDARQADDPACCDGTGDREQVDDTWVPHVLEALFDAPFLDGTNLVFGGRPGKNCGFADWWTLGLRSTAGSR